jgi:hypothetical protein
LTFSHKQGADAFWCPQWQPIWDDYRSEPLHTLHDGDNAIEMRSTVCGLVKMTLRMFSLAIW